MRSSLVPCVLVLAATACGGNNNPPVQDFYSQFASSLCSFEAKCGLMPDAATCTASLQTDSTNLLTTVAQVQAKTITYDSGKAGACIDEYKSMSCTFPGFQRSNDPCNAVFTGTVATGGACFISTQCADNGSCSQTDPTCTPSTMCCAGTCQGGGPKVAIGGDCSNAPCVDGAYCSLNSSTCLAVVTTSGAACEGLDGCANPMSCNGNLGSQPFMGTCVTPAAHGATCDPTALVPCATYGDYCDATTTKCTADVAVGGTCGGASNATCVAYAQCDTTSNTCVAFATAGQTCTTSPDNCLNSLTCTSSGTCALPPAGMTCM